MDFLKQAVFYESPRRLEVAKSMEIAGIHNIRAVLKKYKQNHDSELDDTIACLSGIMESMEIAGNRNCRLNLDFADLFKPLIVDRVIFSVINLGQIKKDEHFSKDASGAVYLNKEGKRIFVSCFEEKLSARINVQGQSYTYRQLVMRDIRSFQRCIRDGEKYKPYKYW